MYTIIIADDEPIIRMGIKASVHWDRLPLKLTGEFASGDDALAAMERSGPVDILITDIRMPVMDGLELTRRALLLNPGMKVVLISSYNDFEYVREGIKLGAADYILKATMEPEELNDVLERCIGGLRKEAEISEQLSQFQRGSAELDRLKREQALKRALSDERSEAEVHAAVFAEDTDYVLLRAVVDHADKMNQTYGKLHLSMQLDELKEAYYNHCPEGTAIASHDEELVALLPYEQDDRKRVLELKTALARDLGLGLTVCSIGWIRSTSLAWCYNRTSELYERRFFEGPGKVYVCDADSSEPRLVRMQEVQEVNSRYAETGNPLLRDKIAAWKQGQTGSQQVKREACELLTTLFIRSLEPSLLMEYYRQLDHAETLAELIEQLVICIHEGESQPALSEKMSSNQLLIQKAMKFIESGFTEELTLQQVADHVHISKNYFSALFKKHTGYNFIDYMIQLRIDMAKELLASRTAKIYEVAERTGFNDVKYFSKLFKKVTGQSPADYREKGTEEGPQG